MYATRMLDYLSFIAESVLIRGVRIR
jgi:hypothetical protein